MTRIDPTTLGAADEGVIASISSIGVLLCMIVSLVGIKIWWFKHRLTFDQSSTQNGAAGGSRPAVLHRQAGSRLSQQFSEPGIGHGLFRRREENEMEILAANTYPPVRIPKRSESTPSLILPQKPRRRHEVRKTAIDNMQPPTREPPRPPTGNLLIPAIQEDFREKMGINIHMELSTVSEHEQQVEARPKPPKRGNRNSSVTSEGSSFTQKFRKTKSVVETNMVQDISRIERRQTGYIKYEEVDIEGLDDVREHNALPDDFEIKPPVKILNDPPVDKQQKKLSDQRHLHLRIDGQNNEMSPLETPTTFIRNYDITGQEFAPKNTMDENITATRDVWAGRETNDKFLTSMTPSPSEFPVKDSPQWGVSVDKDKKPSEYQTSCDEKWDVLDANNRLNTNLGSEVEEEFKKIQRSYKEARSELHEEPSFDEFPAEAHSATVHKHYSYKPKGFGQNIDDDWESFENLDNDSVNMNEISSDMQKMETMAKSLTLNELEHKQEEKIIKNNEEVLENEKLSIKEVGVTQKFVCDLDEMMSNCEEKSTSMTLRHPTGYIKDGSASNEELECDGSKGYLSDESYGERDATPEERRRVRFELLDVEQNCDKPAISSIKKRRNTGYVMNESLEFDDSRPKVTFDLEEEVERETNVNSHSTSTLKERSDLLESESNDVNPTVKAATGLKPKPRQKVTFFDTEEHYLTDEDQGTDSEDDTGTAQQVFPTPMKRITKAAYTYEEPAPAPLLFSTQVSMDDDTEYGQTDASGSSWIAIRQHRMLAQEFQHLSLSVREELVAPAPRKPTPAYRNPLAQMVAETTVDVEDEESIMQATYMCDLPTKTKKTDRLNSAGVGTTEV